jgi:OmpA-OmpF porin, OOP family
MTFHKLLPAAALLLALPAFAQTTYLDMSVGRSKANVDCAGTTSCEDTGTLARAAFGYTFAPNWAAELTLAQLGKLKAAGNVPGVGNVQATATLRSIGLGVAGTLPLNDAFALTARLGVASNKTSLSGSAAGVNASDSDTHTAPYAGIGLNYALTSAISATLSASRTQVRYDGEKASVTSAGLGLQWRF